MRLLAEFEQLFGHGVAGEVGALDHVEADIAKHRRHRLGIDRRVGKLRDILVGAVADDKGDALVGLGRMGGEQHANQGKENGEVAHLKSPAWNLSNNDGSTLGHRLHEKAALRATKNQLCPILPGRDRFRLVRSRGTLRDLDHNAAR